MLNRLLLLVLLLSACAAEPATEADVAEVGVDVEALCSPPITDYTYIISNNGASIVAENSYKTRSLRAWVNYGVCPGVLGHNAYTCAADQCDVNTGSNPNGHSLRLTGCFNLPSCAAWDCRECTLQRLDGSTWNNTGLRLHYQQGYGVSKWLDNNGNHAYTTQFNVAPAKVHAGD